MRIGIMVMPSDDPTAHYGVAWAEFDEKTGCHRKDLRRLYHAARLDLAAKERHDKEKEKK
jgi:hypothetical protein